MTTPVAPTRQPFTPTGPVTGGVGESPRRPDGALKVKGEFAYSSDLWVEGMLWGVTVRSPHPRARIRGIEVARALALPGVAAVLTAEDVPGRKTYGLEIPDQPVLAWDDVRHQGEAVAIVAADHPETARRAADLVEVDYEVLEPLVEAESAIADSAPRLHPSGNVLRLVRVRHGDPDATAEVVVTGEYELGMQDQAALGPESGLAVPDGEGGVDRYMATRWLHVDRQQVAASLGVEPELVRITLAGVGGAFGAREDLSMQSTPACWRCAPDGRSRCCTPRQESFFGHVHRHPCRLRYEHGATGDGRLVFVRARIVFGGGAYASSSGAVCLNAATFAAGPYEVPNVTVDCYMVYTDNPPCGAMRGFGAVQVCFAHESQMDRLAEALGMDPVELRLRSAMRTGTALPTGQRILGPAPVAELLRRVHDRPLPPDPGGGPLDLWVMPGGVSNATHGEGVRRGVGWAVGFKNIGFSAGFDDFATARVRLSVLAGEPLVEVHTAAAEVGQGLVTVQAQIARTELGVERVVVLPADTRVGSAGSSSASRQTWMTGGAVKAACEAVRSRMLELAAARLGRPIAELALAGGDVVAEGPLVDLVDLLGADGVDATREYRHRRTAPAGPRHRAGRGPRRLRLRRPPCRRRRRHRARPGQGGRDRHRPGRRQGHQPPGGRGPDRGRHRPGPRPGPDGGDPGRRGQGPQPLLH
jgi:CO/xanthine dehydrogenase Mo-binding subunit